MNMNTIIQELHKKIALMDKKSFNNFIGQLNKIYERTHKSRKRMKEEEE